MNAMTLLKRRSGFARRRGHALVLAALAVIVLLPLALPAGAAGPAAPAAQPPVLRLYLHGDDVPGTADGFTMNPTLAPGHLLNLNLLNAPRWYSDPPFNTTFAEGTTFTLVIPCLVGLSVAPRYTLAVTNLDGSNPQELAQRGGLLGLCIGERRLQFAVDTPLTLANKRLRLTISTLVSATTALKLGTGTYLEIAEPPPVPFVCDGQVYIIQGANAQLYRVNTDVTPHTFTPIGPTSPYDINAIGYRPTNNLLYGWAGTSPAQVVTIDAAGTVTALGVPTGATLGSAYNNGAVSNDGATYYLYRSNDTVLNVVNLATFTVSTKTLSTPANIADFAQNPQDGLLYSVDNVTDRLVRIDPNTGTVTTIPFVGSPPTSGVGYGGAWFNADGTFVAYANDGIVYTIDLAGPTVIDDQPGPSSGTNDAASCAVPAGG